MTRTQAISMVLGIEIPGNIAAMSGADLEALLGQEAGQEAYQLGSVITSDAPKSVSECRYPALARKASRVLGLPIRGWADMRS